MRPAGYFVFCGGDRECNGIYRDKGTYFASDSGYCLVGEVGGDHGKVRRDAYHWVLQNKAGIPVYSIASSDLIPPRFDWTVMPNMPNPGRRRGEGET